jgi:hypothetical protein
MLRRPDSTELVNAIAENHRALANARAVILTHTPCECEPEAVDVSAAGASAVVIEQLDADVDSPVDPTLTVIGRLRAWMGWTVRSEKQ